MPQLCSGFTQTETKVFSIKDITSVFVHKKTVITGCKINYSLWVLDTLETGYHSIETIFVPLSAPADALTIEYESPKTFQGNCKGSIAITCPRPGLDQKKNTLTDAHSVYCNTHPLPHDLTVRMYKNVPIGGGLGGGSANAAGLLLFMNSLAAESGLTPATHEELVAMAAQVGADVPFFLSPGPKVGCGTGEKLTPCPNPLAGKHLALVSPPLAISTAWAFRTLDEYRLENKISLSKSLTRGGVQAISTFSCGHAPHNDFESVVFNSYPELLHIRDSLLGSGATAALLSGTGSCMFGIFDTAEQAKAYRVSESCPTWVHSFDASGDAIRP